jgi:nitroimidazol reductase NimA-like FMN-containing flavoprotein (pyridoxamine 5'-phosphate oxidase superfamily)
MKEMTPHEIDAFLDEQKIGRMGTRDAESVYVSPLVFARNGNALYCLTTDGRKTRAARTDPAVCFEVDEYDGGTGSWTSVILWGRYEELHGQAHAEAVAILSRRHGTRRPTSPSAAGPEPVRPTIAFRIVIEKASGRWVERADAGGR